LHNFYRWYIQFVVKTNYSFCPGAYSTCIHQSIHLKKGKDMSELVTVNIENHIADVRLNRPDKYNALSPGMFAAVTAAGEAVMKDGSIRVVVMSGNGRGFCAGLDFESFMGMASGTRADDGVDDLMQKVENSPANAPQYVAYVWRQVPVPVIAALHGVAFGGGLQIALAADIRLAAPDARLSVREINWGLVPDMSGTQTLRDDVAKELTYTGREVDAQEAQQLGLVTRVCDDPLAEALALAADIVNKSPHAIRASKQLLQETRHGDVPSGLKMEETLQRGLIGSPNQIEAVKANFEKRAPDFQDPE
jgi:enoyl-CoA hydratase/carnithine racemase